MSRITFGKGNTSIVMDDTTANLVRRVVDDVAPGVMEALEREAEGLYQQAYAKWPVGPVKPERNGVHSRDTLGYDVQIDPGLTVIRARVYCTAEWARYIKPKGMGGKSAFVEFLRKPVRLRAKILAKELGPIIRKLLEGG
jgi:hypothetical protein